MVLTCTSYDEFKVPDNLSHLSRHDLAYFEARSSIFIYMSHVSMKFIQSFNIGCDSPVGIQIKIQIGQISELDSNLKIYLMVHRITYILLLHATTIRLMPESIPWLAANGREEDAERIISEDLFDNTIVIYLRFQTT